MKNTRLTASSSTSHTDHRPLQHIHDSITVIGTCLTNNDEKQHSTPNSLQLITLHQATRWNTHRPATCTCLSFIAVQNGPEELTVG